MAKQEGVHEQRSGIVFYSPLTCPQSIQSNLMAHINKGGEACLVLPHHIGLILARHSNARRPVLEGLESVESGLQPFSEPRAEATCRSCERGVLWSLLSTMALIQEHQMLDIISICPEYELDYLPCYTSAWQTLL